MREICQSGSEGGGAELNRSSLPLSLGRFSMVRLKSAYGVRVLNSRIPL